MIRAALLLCWLTATSAESRFTLYVFLSTGCPISARYAPEIQRLHAIFADRVSFRLVFPNADEPESSIAAHLKEYRLPEIAGRDPGGRLAARAGATVTPEAALFDGGKLVYRGRIDNRHLNLGKSRPVVTERDLEEAILAALAGRVPERRTTRAVGCAIRR